MFLKSLIIESTSGLVREIKFHKGLNLIIDETQTDTLQESGNNVGKTTVLKLIDFCFGNDGNNIYKDPEFRGKSNTIVETYLKDNNVNIKLILQKQLDGSSNEEIEIKKNFLNRNQKVQEINGEQYNDRDFDKKLKQLIFNSNTEKPTFRQIISKNIRYEKNRLDYILRVLHNSTTFEEYEALYFFWLGIDTDTASRKQNLQSLKSTEESILKNLKRDSNEYIIKQALSVINRDIDELNIVKSNFNVNENFERDLNDLNKIKADINRISTEILRLEVRKDIILEAKEELEKEYANIDSDLLKEMYRTAQHFIPKMQVQFEEMLAFHNNMLKEKIKFISGEIPAIKKELVILNEKLKAAITTEKNIAEKLNKSGAIRELENIIFKLNVKYEQKGKYEEQLRQFHNSRLKLEEIEISLSEINDGIASYDKDLEKRISEFNVFFSKISQKLYDEQFILSQQKNTRAYELKVTSIDGNLGTGKKKGQIAAFDIAYIQFCDANNIPCLHFILYDQVENIHDNQLTILADVTSQSNVQYVIPVLRDKLPPDLDPDSYKVLSLSQSEKLFKL